MPKGYYYVAVDGIKPSCITVFFVAKGCLPSHRDNPLRLDDERDPSV